MLVIDTSAALYLLASENGVEPFADLDLTAPALLWSEVTSVLNEMRWRGELSPPLAGAAFDRLFAAPIDRHASEELYRDAREGWDKSTSRRREHQMLPRQPMTPRAVRVVIRAEIAGITTGNAQSRRAHPRR